MKPTVTTSWRLWAEAQKIEADIGVVTIAEAKHYLDDPGSIDIPIPIAGLSWQSRDRIPGKCQITILR